MMTFTCPKCGYTSESYEPSWQAGEWVAPPEDPDILVQERPIDAFLWTCTRGQDIECGHCGHSGCLIGPPDHPNCKKWA